MSNYMSTNLPHNQNSDEGFTTAVNRLNSGNQAYLQFSSVKSSLIPRQEVLNIDYDDSDTQNESKMGQSSGSESPNKISYLKGLKNVTLSIKKKQSGSPFKSYNITFTNKKNS
mmetsp:Transcript_32868/g.37645  ORF Transcript_32868/g.37645 Transcript_32868/m.37645 type:complete len:113 (-) Transcript_32868:539-877(-)